MSYTRKDTEALEAQVERIRARRKGGFNRERLRTWLNALFLVVAIAGLVVYFMRPESHVAGLATIGVAMLFKVAEFIVRLM